MASTQEIKRRIKAVTSTSQITRAMEMVSATKMRKAQEVALLSRPFAVEALRILSELSHRTSYLPEIMKEREVKKRAVVFIASDRGLAGSFNSNVFRSFERKLENELQHTTAFIAVGKKAEEFINRKNLPLHASFKNFGDHIKVEQTKPVTDLLIQGFLRNEWDRVTVVSTHFRTTLRQDVLVRDVLPIERDKVVATIKEIIPEYGRFSNTQKNGNGLNGNGGHDYEYLIEPDPQTVLDRLAPDLVEITLYDLILEANASEHSARMVAMKNASENAGELKDELVLHYNKARQAGITQEIAEIVGGSQM